MTKEQTQQAIKSLMAEVDLLEADRVMLVKASSSWWRSEAKRDSFLRAATAVALSLVAKRQELEDFRFQLCVQTHGWVEAHAQRVSKQIAEDVERDVFQGLFAADRAERKLRGLSDEPHFQGDGCDLGHGEPMPVLQAWGRLKPLSSYLNRPTQAAPVAPGEDVDLSDLDKPKGEKYPSKRGHRKTITNTTRAELRKQYRDLTQGEFNRHLHAAQAVASKRFLVDWEWVDLHALYKDLIPGDFRLHLAALEDVAVERATNPKE